MDSPTAKSALAMAEVPFRINATSLLDSATVLMDSAAALVISAKLVTMDTRIVAIVTATGLEQLTKFAMKTLANVFVNRVTLVVDVISVTRATLASPIALNVPVTPLDQFHLTVHPLVSADVSRLSVGQSVPIVQWDTSSTPNASHATVTRMAHTALPVTTKAIAFARKNSTEPSVLSVKKATTTTLDVKLAIAIRLV